MKKRLFLILLAVLSVVFVFSACGNKGGDDTSAQNPSGNTPSDNTPTCEHVWEVSTTATCTTGGEKTEKCTKCNAEQKTSATALGHDFQKSATVDPTCQTKGYDLYTCSRNCGIDPEKRNEFPTSITGLGQYHKYVEDANATAPTCIEAGYTQKICEYCKAPIDRKTLPALGHSFERTYADGETDPTEVVTIQPICEVNGQITYNCSDCDEVKVITYESLIVEGATEEDLALAETLKALEHEFTVKKEEVLATCLTSGYLVMGCANEGCEETKKVADYDPLGHTYVREGVTEFSYEVKLQPTCSTPGAEWVVCDDCGYCSFDDETKDEANSREVPATGEHVFDTFVNTLAPDCTEIGYDVYKCSLDEKCGETTNKNEVPALGHNWVKDEELLVNGQPTCLTNGNIPYYCDNYGFSYGCLEGATCYNAKGEKPDEIRHTGYTQGVYASEPTCIKNAMYYCNDCEQEFEAYAEDADALASGKHIYEKDYARNEVFAATCKEYGYTKYVCCADEDCNEFKYDSYTVRIPHELSEVTSDGITACAICEDKFINTTTEIATEFKDGKNVVVSSTGTRLCGPRCQGCPIHDILIFVTASTAPNDPTVFVQDGDVYKTTYAVGDKKVSLIELLGSYGQDYTITLKDEEGNVVDKFVANINGADVELNVKTEGDDLYDVSGTMYIDIAEVSDKVATIEISSSAESSVNYYTNYESNN